MCIYLNIYIYIYDDELVNNKYNLQYIYYSIIDCKYLVNMLGNMILYYYLKTTSGYIF